jgi:hypothetical protein
MLCVETRAKETRRDASNNLDFFIIFIPIKVKNVEPAPHLNLLCHRFGIVELLKKSSKQKGIFWIDY